MLFVLLKTVSNYLKCDSNISQIEKAYWIWILPEFNEKWQTLGPNRSVFTWDCLKRGTLKKHRVTSQLNKGLCSGEQYEQYAAYGFCLSMKRDVPTHFNRSAYIAHRFWSQIIRVTLFACLLPILFAKQVVVANCQVLTKEQVKLYFFLFSCDTMREAHLALAF